MSESRADEFEEHYDANITNADLLSATLGDAIEALREVEADRDDYRNALERISRHGDEVAAAIAETVLPDTRVPLPDNEEHEHDE